MTSTMYLHCIYLRFACPVVDLLVTTVLLRYVQKARMHLRIGLPLYLHYYKIIH